MRVPLSWLREFAPFDLDPVTLGQTFDDLGMVVEAMERVGDGLDGVVVARVLEVVAHPGADRVRLARVDAGDGQPRQIVCGAPNVAAGQLVPLATIGTVLPGGLEIARRKVRGEWSEGMICSPVELGLGDDGDGIMVLPEGPGPGTPLVEALGGADVVYDLAIEANRPDALSVAGIARDAAARLGLPFALPEADPCTGPGAAADLASVRVESPDLCPRFTARVITDVVVGPSPEWMARRLTLAGMRPIANVVDASNYVMLELGQPTHPYDLDRLPGRGLLVRRAARGEVLVTLDGVERRLGDGDDCLICDATGVPVGIGGIMGGASSEISPATSTVLLEAAYFTPMAIARTAKRLGLRTEASARFERGCDPLGIERATARLCGLLGTGTVVGGQVDVSHLPPVAAPIRVRTVRVNALLGTDLGDDDVRRYLAPIGFNTVAAGAGRTDVMPPSFRPDATAEIDVVEEVARHHGYSRIPRARPTSPFVGRLTPYQQARRELRQVLVGLGVSEAVTSPLLGPGDHRRAGIDGEAEGAAIVAVDPLAREESVLRTSLRPGLLAALAYNASHRNPDVSLFEVGHVFRVPPDIERGRLPDEREILGVALGGGDGAPAAARALGTVLEAFRRSDICTHSSPVTGLHPTRSAELRAGGAVIGVVGEVDPAVALGIGLDGRVGWLELDLRQVLPAERVYPQARAVSRHPSSDIDLAFVVPDGVPADEAAATVRRAAGDLLVDLALFDVYRDDRLGRGRRSLAWRLRLQAADRTLTDADVADVRARVIGAVQTAHGAELRA